MPGSTEGETDHDGEQPDLRGIAVEAKTRNADRKDVDDEQSNIGHE